MREKNRNGRSIRGLAEEVGVCYSTARAAIQGATWSHLPGAFPPIPPPSSPVWKKKKGHPRGAEHHAARLTDRLVLLIRLKHGAGRSIRGLAKEFGVGYTTVWDIVNYKTWAYIRPSKEYTDMCAPHGG